MYTDELLDNSVAVYKSFDNGATWAMFSSIDTLRGTDGESYYEPYAIEFSDGRIMIAVRKHCKHGKEKFTVMTVVSSDVVCIWSIPKRTGICGSPPPSFMRHSSGAIIGSVGRRKEPFGERAYISYNDGKTWREEYMLRDDAPDGDWGYPSTVELPDSSLLTVYY